MSFSCWRSVIMATTFITMRALCCACRCAGGLFELITRCQVTISLGSMRPNSRKTMSSATWTMDRFAAVVGTCGLGARWKTMGGFGMGVPLGFLQKDGGVGAAETGRRRQGDVGGD